MFYELVYIAYVIGEVFLLNRIYRHVEKTVKYFTSDEAMRGQQLSVQIDLRDKVTDWVEARYQELCNHYLAGRLVMLERISRMLWTINLIWIGMCVVSTVWIGTVYCVKNAISLWDLPDELLLVETGITVFSTLPLITMTFLLELKAEKTMRDWSYERYSLAKELMEKDFSPWEVWGQKRAQW